MITFQSSGSFRNTEKFLSAMTKKNTILSTLQKYGRLGVQALAAATPTESGLTAASWDFEVKVSGRSYSITWTNSHVVDGLPIVILLQYGHGTGTGGYVQGRDFINPAMKPIFDKIAEEVWKAVTSA